MKIDTGSMHIICQILHEWNHGLCEPSVQPNANSKSISQMTSTYDIEFICQHSSQNGGSNETRSGTQ